MRVARVQYIAPLWSFFEVVGEMTMMMLEIYIYSNL